MHDHGQAFRSAICEALSGYLVDRIAALGVDPTALGAEIDATVDRVAAGLGDLMELPFDRQADTPLDVVRRSLEPLGEVLRDRGVNPPSRDEEQQRVAPGDHYSLAPASAAELGEAALEASLAWGLSKTSALSRPTLLVVTANLMDASRFEPIAAAAGYRLESGRHATASVTPLVAFVDLESDGADGAIRSLADAGVRVVAYGPHVDDHALVRATALGASAAEPRSRMFRDPSAHLRPLV